MALPPIRHATTSDGIRIAFHTLGERPAVVTLFPYHVNHLTFVHRWLGVAGGALAALMIVSGTVTAMKMVARGAAPEGADPHQFLMIPLSDMVFFGGFVAAALLRRADREAHKRLMLLAYVSIVVAALARLLGVLALGPPVFFGLAFLVVLAGVIYDKAARGRVHPVYVWGGGLLVISVPLRLAFSRTEAWKLFAEWAVSQMPF